MTNKELLELRARREKLEKETKALAQKQRGLEDNVCLLEEKVSIEELEKKQKELRKAVLDLEANKEELESKLRKKPVRKKVSKSKKVATRLENKEPPIVEEAKDENSIDDLEITTVVDSPVEEQKPVKKKRRFF